MDQEAFAQMIADQARLEGKIDTLTAITKAGLARNADEIKALFAKARETAKSVEDIRVDYTPKQDFRDHEDLDRREHGEISKVVDGVKWKLAIICGGISLGAFLIGLLIKGLGAMGK